jgi:ER membrane protein complex subunit 1, C-terminal
VLLDPLQHLLFAVLLRLVVGIMGSLGTLSIPGRCFWLLFLLFPFAGALFQEDAGRLDFFIATSGHGSVRSAYATPDGTAVVTWSGSSVAAPLSSSSKSRCYLASRSIVDGSLLWRRNVCSVGGEEGRSWRVVTAVSPSSGLIHTLDVDGRTLRTWRADSGALVWEATEIDSEEIWSFTEEGNEYVASAAKAVFSARTGESVKGPKLRKDPSLEAQETTAECKLANLQVKAAKEGGASTLRARFTTASASADEDRIVPHLTSESMASDDRIQVVALLTCAAKRSTVLVATQRGSTSLVELEVREGRGFMSEVKWTAHEGLGQVQAALLLDSSHYVGDLDPGKSLELLSLSSRLKSQWQRLCSSVFGPWQVPDGIPSSRQGAFGFVKTAVLLTPSQVLGVGTVGAKRGHVAYVLNLPMAADGWTTRLIHSGSPPLETHFSSRHGHVGTHHRDVLAVSTKGTSLEWTCFDGTTGTVHDSGKTVVTAPVVQVVPMLGAFPCRQAALLQLRDGAIQLVPSSEEASLAVTTQLQKDGLYTHSIVNEGGNVRLGTAHLTVESQGFQSQKIGSAFLPNEEIVRVVYQRRDEFIASPYLAQGDDSILLKYLNPHLVVVVTMSRDTDYSRFNSTIAEALKTRKVVGSGLKRKPLGATGSSASPVSDSSSEASDPSPNLFVNVFDTVSGRLLYRVSHSNAQSDPRPTAIISENWIFYSFANEKSRRGELGVLSLYEGMVDSSGLTAFATPDLTTSFSSLDARESKPVVLAKTFSLARPVTALGMTLTRSGISSRRLVLASVDGRVYTLDRKSLEPRRPVGPLKDSEKKEGLMQYSEFIPSVSYLVLSYNRTVEGATHILAAPTDLESQALVLAYGGPDLFFARTSPSRGFDLLPDSFNRVMLSLVVLALIVVTGVLRQRVGKTVQKHGWM